MSKFSITEHERSALAAWENDSSLPEYKQVRASMILLLNQGLSIKEICSQKEVDRKTVRKWRDRWLASSDKPIEQRLDDAPRCGAPTKMQRIQAHLEERRKRYGDDLDNIPVQCNTFHGQYGFETFDESGYCDQTDNDNKFGTFNSLYRWDWSISSFYIQPAGNDSNHVSIDDYYIPNTCNDTNPPYVIMPLQDNGISDIISDSNMPMSTVKEWPEEFDLGTDSFCPLPDDCRTYWREDWEGEAPVEPWLITCPTTARREPLPPMIINKSSNQSKGSNGHSPHQINPIPIPVCSSQDFALPNRALPSRALSNCAMETLMPTYTHLQSTSFFDKPVFSHSQSGFFDKIAA